ncbi:hypothetical protein HDV00_011519 [Rhizophlyctis rosea]|nr:hypothetical protein HDV00_011519 [Rhizophlyctis rosea]
MAWIYLQSEGTIEKAHQRVKEGILNYNKANGHRVTHLYNETITKFFLHLINLALNEDRTSSSQPSTSKKDAEDDDDDDVFVSFLAKYPFLEDRKLMYRFYSREVLHSEDAAERWVEPDRQSMPSSLKELELSK